ncbi:M16 family metallopeptidase [Fictibacillus norfolkensis]|uniref:Insulinase family protein n=1 Tax=Fictibacillus norfolkensis TaxID=2762233 RepID=A0ABR8SL94_9BACL|nr:pitrilysin family protein [Fictibacillus norfolkensis]MBD7964239.1 insulinase family protein [Fictibacillus norfolkensis]
MIKRYTCSNGVRIVLENIPTVRSVAIGVWIGTGSRFENTKNNGISHFLEHMFFKGTKTRTAREIAESFDSIGGQVNAFTSKEYTCYYAKVLDTHSPYALEVLADMFFNSTFDEGELLKEKNVVLEEIKMYEDTPDDIVHDMLSRASFQNHELGFPILGTEETLNTFSGSTLRDYMDTHYVPEEVVISVAGNVDESFIKEVEKWFGDYKTSGIIKPEIQSPVFYPEKLSRKKETEQAHLCLGFPGLSLKDKRSYSLIILNNIFGSSMSSRLFQEVREQKGLAYSVFSYHSAFQDNGIFTIYGGTAPHQLDELYNTILNIVDDLKENGITDKELKNSKEQIKGNLMLSLESTNSRMSRNGKHELILGYHRTLDDMVESIDNVSKDDVNMLVQSIFSEGCSASLVSPQGELPKGLQ